MLKRASLPLPSYTERDWNMARTIDLLDSIGVAEDGISIAYPETFMDDIRGAYGADADAAAARIAILEADLAAAQQEIVLLQAHNYQLMVSVPADEPDDAEQGEPEGEPDDNDDNSGVDSLFTEKEDK